MYATRLHQRWERIAALLEALLMFSSVGVILLDVSLFLALVR
jgi:hypothetical protein